MNISIKTWVIGTLLLGTMAYAIAEEITLTTYYPSPRGVYKELLVQTLTLSPPGNLSVPGSLAVGPTYNPGAPGDLLVEGGLGVGTPIPTEKLEVSGGSIYAHGPSVGMGRVVMQLDSGNQFEWYPDAGGLSLYNRTSTTTPVYFTNAGNVGIGTTNPHPSAIVDLSSTNRGLLLPRTTPGSIPSPAKGLLIYNTTTDTLEFSDNTQWRPLGAPPLSLTGIFTATALASCTGTPCPTVTVSMGSRFVCFLTGVGTDPVGYNTHYGWGCRVYQSPAGTWWLDAQSTENADIDIVCRAICMNQF